MVLTNEAGGWDLWEEKPRIYLKMAMSLEHPLGPAMLHSPQQRAPNSRKQEDPPGNRRCSPQTCQLALCCLRPLGQAQRVEVGWCSVHRLQIWLDSVQKGTGK